MLAYIRSIFFNSLGMHTEKRGYNIMKLILHLCKQGNEHCIHCLGCQIYQISYSHRRLMIINLQAIKRHNGLHLKYCKNSEARRSHLCSAKASQLGEIPLSSYSCLHHIPFCSWRSPDTQEQFWSLCRELQWEGVVWKVCFLSKTSLCSLYFGCSAMCETEQEKDTGNPFGIKHLNVQF